MKKAIIIVAIFTAYLWGYNIGHLDLPQTVIDHRIDNMNQIVCDDIIQDKDGMVRCEINMKNKDENIKIFKELDNK